MSTRIQIWNYIIIVVEYLTAAALASLFFVVLTAVHLEIVMSSASKLYEIIKYVLISWMIVSNISVVSMLIPWLIATWLYHKLQLHNLFYFPLVGASAAFIIGCTVLALLPKPLFVEDQPFYVDITIAVERAGIPLLLAGAFGGLTYWFVSERRRLSG